MRQVLIAFEPPDGGVAENVAQLATGLEARGWRPVVAGPPEATIYPRLEAAKIEYRRLPLARRFGGPTGALKALRELRAMLSGDRFDLVHAHSSKAGLLARLAARGLAPAVYTPHCFGFVGDVGRAQRLLAIAVERALGHATAALICVCEAERREGLAAGVAPPERLWRVYNGVEDCPPENAPAASLAGLRGSGPVVGAIAVLRRQKRLDLLIDAAPQILDAHPEATIAIIGNGPEEERLRARAAALGLDREERFAMLPFADSSWPYLAALDLYVLPSEWEAFPIGVLEALACGVPQVATDVGGTGEAVLDGETGLLSAPDPGRIAAAVVELLDDPARLASMRSASRRRQAASFTVGRMVDDTVAVYDTIARSRG